MVSYEVILGISTGMFGWDIHTDCVDGDLEASRQEGSSRRVDWHSKCVHYCGGRLVLYIFAISHQDVSVIIS